MKSERPHHTNELNLKTNYLSLSSYNLCYLFIFGSIIGVIMFVFLYGIRILNFTYTDWIFTIAGDFSAHQLGFEFFRNSPWKFPLGNYNNYGYPIETSIVYSDSIPLFAIFFKLLSPILPNNFQYFGLWGILCFAAQGGISCLIFAKYTKYLSAIFLMCPMFVYAPGVIWRMYGHSALAGHWVVLLAIYFWLNSTEFNTIRKKILIWCGLCSLSVLIHPYFLVMVGVIMLGFLLDDYSCYKNIKNITFIFLSAIISTLLVFFLIGGFTRTAGFVNEGLGIYSMNMNALWNPQGFSKFLKDQPILSGQYEGFQYLGIGIWILLIIMLAILICDSTLRDFLLWCKLKFSYIVVILMFTILALSPCITLNERTLFSWMWIEPIVKLLQPFRSTGRLFWPVVYLLMLFPFIVVCQKVKSKKVICLLLAICACLQLYDLTNLYQVRNAALLKKETLSYSSPLVSDFWEEIAGRYTHLTCLSWEFENIIPLARYAANHKMTINVAYTARRQDTGKDLIEQAIKNIVYDEIPPDTLYIALPGKSIFGHSLTHGNVIELNIDGYKVFANKNTVDVEKYNHSIESPEISINLIQEYEAKNSEAATLPLPKQGMNYKLIDIMVANVMESGATVRVSGTLINQSQYNWYSFNSLAVPVSLSYHWYNLDRSNICFDYPRTFFEKVIRPGDEKKFNMAVEVPQVAPGKYLLMLDCVQDGVSWFSDLDNSNYVYEVEIK